MSEPVLAGQPAVLEGVRLVKHYPPVRARGKGKVVHALDGVNIALRQGRCLGVVGESGSGKSTIARVLSLLVEPTSGEIRLDGRRVKPRSASELARYRSQVQMVFQDPFSSLNPAKSIEYILSRPLIVRGRAHGRAEVRRQLNELLETVGLTPPDEFLVKYPHELSGGQRQRVGFARALAVGARVLLADEPVSMLDVSIRAGILNLMARLRDESGLAIMYITHDLASARYLSDDIMVMYAGEAVEFGPADLVCRQSLHPYTQLLLSSVPDADAPGGGPLPPGAQSEPPNTVDPPTGCRFHPRCPYAMPICSEVSPEPVYGPDGRWVRCHLYTEGGLSIPTQTAEPSPLESLEAVAAAPLGGDPRKGP